MSDLSHDLSSEKNHYSPLTIMVLLGGPSQEREVSLKTGAAMIESLQRLGHEVIPFDPQRDQLSELVAHITLHKPDLVFNALHGTYGEDGVIQGVLEWMGVSYTGSKLTASALAMDKALSRKIFMDVGVDVAAGTVWEVGDEIPPLEILSSGPWVVKPTSEGSSVGLHLCRSYADLVQTLTLKDHAGPKAWLIEEYVYGAEVSVVVFEGEVWGSVEIAPSVELYDYEAKYQRDDTQYFCPPRLDPAVISRLEDLGRLAYQALGCVGVCRADFITTATEGERVSEGSRSVDHQARDIILEVNTLPGMTETSLVPKVAASRGVSFDDLMQKMIQVELERGERS